MNFHRLVPGPPLNTFVEHLWLYDGFMPSYGREKLLPNGAMELIIDLRDHPKHKWDRRDLVHGTAYRKSWLSGMQTEYIVIEASPGSMMGAHFRPAGAWPFFGAPLGEFADHVIELDSVVGMQAGSLRDRLLEAPTPEGKLKLLEQWLLARGGESVYPDRAVHHALQQMLSLPMRLLIRDLAAKVGISQKHLIHLFDQQVGVRPKQLDRILRFNRVLTTIAQSKPREMDWAAVALDCGYYDQSHFIHDFEAFAGMTPSAYLAQSATSEYPDYVRLD
jgi:AraC-like DNA-binding protein